MVVNITDVTEGTPADAGELVVAEKPISCRELQAMHAADDKSFETQIAALATPVSVPNAPQMETGLFGWVGNAQKNKAHHRTLDTCRHTWDKYGESVKEIVKTNAEVSKSKYQAMSQAFTEWGRVGCAQAEARSQAQQFVAQEHYRAERERNHETYLLKVEEVQTHRALEMARIDEQRANWEAANQTKLRMQQLENERSLQDWGERHKELDKHHAYQLTMQRESNGKEVRLKRDEYEYNLTRLQLLFGRSNPAASSSQSQPSEEWAVLILLVGGDGNVPGTSRGSEPTARVFTLSIDDPTTLLSSAIAGCLRRNGNDAGEGGNIGRVLPSRESAKSMRIPLAKSMNSFLADLETQKAQFGCFHYLGEWESVLELSETLKGHRCYMIECFRGE